MTKKREKKPSSGGGGAMTCEAFVAGNQCFRCEQVENRHAGSTFDTEMQEWEAWFRQIEQRVVAHKAGPNYIPATQPPLTVHEAVDLYW